MWILWDRKFEYGVFQITHAENSLQITRDLTRFLAFVIWKTPYSHFLLTVFSHWCPSPVSPNEGQMFSTLDMQIFHRSMLEERTIQYSTWKFQSILTCATYIPSLILIAILVNVLPNFNYDSGIVLDINGLFLLCQNLIWQNIDICKYIKKIAIGSGKNSATKGTKC